MSEESKQPVEEEQIPTAQEAAAATERAAAEEAQKAKAEKKKKGKAKTYSLTEEQMQAAEEAARKLAESQDQLLRLGAEYENYRKRTAKEKDSIYEDSKVDAIKAFLPVYDNLERAVATEGDEDSPHKKGLELIFNQYKEILEKLGVTEIPALGKPFDPQRHNAVMHIDDENLGENTVAQVFQAGFMLGEKVIRFSTVQVAN